jgi:hypothetical protein
MAPSQMSSSSNTYCAASSFASAPTRTPITKTATRSTSFPSSSRVCTTTTIAVPKDCAAARGTQWFASRFSGVDQSLRFDYKVGGKEFVLFGSEEMVGNRDWDGE